MDVQEYNPLCYLNGASEAPGVSEQRRTSCVAAENLLGR
jgi:hypothetical protein